MSDQGALPPLEYRHEARVLPYGRATQPNEPHDGDTAYMLIRIGYRTLTEVYVRLAGINCPELKKADRRTDNPAGLAAKAFTWDWLATAAKWGRDAFPLQVDSLCYAPDDKYGMRADCLVRRKLDGRSLSNDLIAAGHATPMKP